MLTDFRFARRRLFKSPGLTLLAGTHSQIAGTGGTLPSQAMDTIMAQALGQTRLRMILVSRISAQSRAIEGDCRHPASRCAVTLSVSGASG
jgi:hypothetical protein